MQFSTFTGVEVSREPMIETRTVVPSLVVGVDPYDQRPNPQECICGCCRRMSTPPPTPQANPQEEAGSAILSTRPA